MDQALNDLVLTNERVITHYPSQVLDQVVQPDGSVTNLERNSSAILQFLKITNPPANASILITKAEADDDLGVLKLTVQLVSTVVGFNGTRPAWDTSKGPAPTVKSKTREIMVTTRPF